MLGKWEKKWTQGEHEGQACTTMSVPLNSSIEWLYFISKWHMRDPDSLNFFREIESVNLRKNEMRVGPNYILKTLCGVFFYIYFSLCLSSSALCAALKRIQIYRIRCIHLASVYFGTTSSLKSIKRLKSQVYSLIKLVKLVIFS